MKKLTLFLVSFAFVASAAEYGHFSRQETTNDWSHSVVLNEGDRFVFLGSNKVLVYSANYLLTEDCMVSFLCLYQDMQITRELTSFEKLRYLNPNSSAATSYTHNRDEASRTITGPCTIIPQIGNDDLVVDYKIIRAHEESDSSKYNASLNADGSRLAIALKQAGSNAVTRVYEFDGSSWNQLGEDVE